MHVKYCKKDMLLCVLLFLLLSDTNRLLAQWKQQGASPSRGGQVEGIVDKEVAGAIKCVLPHPNDNNIAYIGSVNGGVWKTVNATSVKPIWVFISADFPSQSIGALQFDPTDPSFQTLVAGTGRNSSFYDYGAGSFGIFLTKSAGISWTNIDRGGTFQNLNITGIAPRGKIVVVTTLNGGTWRTNNLGLNWSQISGAAGSGLPDGNSYDLAVDPQRTNILYTNAGDRGIYKSIDFGETWQKISDPAVDANLKKVSNLKLATGGSNNIFLGIVESGSLKNIYYLSDGTTSWKELDLPSTYEGRYVHGVHVGYQGNIHFSMAADPINVNILYVGGDRQPWATEPDEPVTWPNSIGANDFSGRLFKLNSALPRGSQSSAITHSGTQNNSSPHADSRGMAFDRDGNLLECDDGGIFKRTNPSQLSGDWFSLNGNLNVTEMHSACWDANMRIIISGAQDNGTPQQEFSDNVSWKSISTGDGGEVCVDDFSSKTTSTRYSSFDGLQYFRKTVWSQGNIFNSESYPSLIDISTGKCITGFNFVAPVRINRQDGNRLIIASNTALFESFDQGNTVRNIGDITVNGDGRHVMAYGSKDNADAIYVGSRDKVMVRSASNPTSLAISKSYKGNSVEGLAINNNHYNECFVIDKKNIYRTENSGDSWISISYNLNEFNPGDLHSVAFIESVGIVVGTDNGVYLLKAPQYTEWSKLGSELPNVSVFDLEYNTTDRILVAATMGMGAWSYKF